MVNEAENSISQWKNVFRRESLNELCKLPLHLRCRLARRKRVGMGGWEVGRMEAKIECEWEGWQRQRLGLGNDWLSDPAVCDTKLGHQFDFWLRHCTAILISIPLYVSFFFLTHVMNKGSSLRWIPSWNARFYLCRSIKPISFDINPPRKSSGRKKANEEMP